MHTQFNNNNNTHNLRIYLTKKYTGAEIYSKVPEILKIKKKILKLSTKVCP